MSCQTCAGSSEQPPGSTSGVNALVGVSSFGGNVRVPTHPCGPPTCPTPPTSEAEVLTPYCPLWVKQLTPEASGRLLIVVDDCLHELKSKCSGMLQYDAAGQRVRVIDPPYVSSIPQEKRFGYLAKVVPTLRKICIDGSDECAEEVRQELAAQLLETASCGELVIANPPLCGDVAPQEAADLAQQVRFDYLNAALHEDAGCPEGVRFLAYYMGKRGSAQAQVDCKQWVGMRGLQLRGSDWGFLLKTSPQFKTALPAVFEKVEGTDENNPCFTLRIAESQAQGLPENPNNCDILVFAGKAGTEPGAWKNVQKGLQFFPTVQSLLFNHLAAVSTTFALPGYPLVADTDKVICDQNKVWARIRINCGLSTSSGNSGLVQVFIGGVLVARFSPFGSWTWEISAKVNTANPALAITALSATAIQVNATLLGYEY